MVWCYGAVHHTGNTYQAIYNVTNMVKPGGKLFMMIYGYPESVLRFQELNLYDDLREKTRNFSFEEKFSYLEKKYSKEKVHGYFDAISPQINDILSFEKIKMFLTTLGFSDIKLTLDNANHHFIATKD